MPIIGTGAGHLRDYNIRRITRGDSGVNRVYQNATAPILVIGAKNRLRQLNDSTFEGFWTASIGSAIMDRP